MREEGILTLLFFIGFITLGFIYVTSDYKEFHAIAVNEEIVSEESFTIKVYDSKTIDQFGLTELRYIDDYNWFGKPEFQTIRLTTNQTIYPDDKIELKKLVIITECDYYEKIDESLVLYNMTFISIYDFGLKSDYTGDYDKCGQKYFYKFITNEHNSGNTLQESKD